MSETTPEPSPLTWTTIHTTLPQTPFPSSITRQPITTPRLTIRPFQPTDLAALFLLRSQPEVMIWTGQGRPDADYAASETHLSNMLPPKDTSKYNFVICSNDTGEFIGIGGCHKVEGEFGWPVTGYMLKKEAWGRGYATEFVKGFLDAWWALPRREVDLTVESATVDTTELGDSEMQEEQIVAVTADGNAASNNVLLKCGFKLVKTWTEPDLRDQSQQVLLYGFTAKRPVVEK